MQGMNELFEGKERRRRKGKKGFPVARKGERSVGRG